MYSKKKEAILFSTSVSYSTYSLATSKSIKIAELTVARESARAFLFYYFMS